MRVPNILTCSKLQNTLYRTCIIQQEYNNNSIYRTIQFYSNKLFIQFTLYTMSGRTYGRKRKFKYNNPDHKSRTRVDHTAPKPVYNEADLLDAHGNQWIKPGSKKHIALLIAYNGTAYNGLQIQEYNNTIEYELLNAIWKAGLISPYNKFDTQKLHFMRAARTDKGVHAVSNLISLEIHIPPKGYLDNKNKTNIDVNNNDTSNDNVSDNESTNSHNNNNNNNNTTSSSTDKPNNYSIDQYEDIVPMINQYLPDDITVLGWLAVSGSFHAKNSCTSRIYEYILPASIFIDSPLLNNPPPISQTALTQTFIEAIEHKQRFGNHKQNNDENYTTTNNNVTDEQKLNDAIPLSIDTTLSQPELHTTGKIITPQLRDVINAVLSYFIGTKNYHNLVQKTKEIRTSTVNHINSNDAGAYNRFIMNFTLNDVFDYNGTEFVRLTIHGQSFLYNQIRKMVALAVCVVKGIVPINIFDDIFTWRSYNIPTAPALGLLLDRTIYRGYDLRVIYNSTMQHCETMEHAYQRTALQADTFKRQKIYTQICSQELATHEFSTWLQSLNNEAFKPIDTINNNNNVNDNTKSSESTTQANAQPEQTTSTTTATTTTTTATDNSSTIVPTDSMQQDNTSQQQTVTMQQ